MNTNSQNIACLGKIMSICNKKHFSNICEAQFMKNLSNTEAELKKRVAYKKACNQRTLICNNGLVQLNLF